MIRQVREINPGETVYVVKKGTKYITVKNNELAKTPKQFDAICFKSESEADNFIGAATVDSRNQRMIGRGYWVAPVTRPA